MEKYSQSELPNWIRVFIPHLLDNMQIYVSHLTQELQKKPLPSKISLVFISPKGPSYKFVIDRAQVNNTAWGQSGGLLVKLIDQKSEVESFCLYLKVENNLPPP